ncbi:uncharacterized protein LOC144710119 [Wolffia australiana]
MVGIFSRLYGGKIGHRRTRSATESRAPAATSSSIASASSRGFDVPGEFKSIEHPSEPFDHVEPVKCPLPEPSIINDGRIWKERISATAQARAEVPSVIKESSSVGSERSRIGNRRLILPSFSAPEHKILNLLDECNIKS